MALVLSHLVVISHQVDAGGGVSLLERTAFAALSPIERGVHRAVEAVSSAWSGYVSLRGVREENADLEARLRGLELQLQDERRGALESDRLRELLDLKKALPFETLAAEVVAREGLPFFRAITLDKGTSEGVALDAPVISASGVVGRVVSVGPHAAKVQLVLDRDAGMGVLIERNRATGVVAGQIGSAEVGDRDVLMRYVPALADVVPGDRVLTSGLDHIFPKGLVVGRVRSVGPPSGLFRDVVVTPSARFDTLEEVLIVNAPRDKPAFAESVR